MAKTTPDKPGLFEFAGYAVKNARRLGASKRKNAVRAQLCLANIELAKLELKDPLRLQRVREFDAAMVEFQRAKWLTSEAAQTGSRDTWKLASAAFDLADRMGAQLLHRLKAGDPTPVAFEPVSLEHQGTELSFAGDVPLVPEITPIVFLKGSDFEMGRQYAQQLVEIFGKWILARHAGRKFSTEELEVLGRWEHEHRTHTPWVLEFCRGWAAGAVELGIATSYEEVLDLWVGHKPPGRDYLDTGGLPEIPTMSGCSGVAAWGSATRDGKLFTGSTGDHELSFQVTIVGFPDQGHRFIYSPFGATGEIAGAGQVYFFGHPAMNDQGLAYVHHGGGPKFLEPHRLWGYGIRRAASVIQILRFCKSAHEARALEQSWPIGDVGWGDQATVGGFWADGKYAYVLEGRAEPLAVREAGMLGERDFLYANNSVAHPAAIESEWMAKDKGEWFWDPNGGWRPKTPTGMTKSLGLMLTWASGRLSTSDLLRRGMMYAYTNSCARNRYLFQMMEARHGLIDLDYMEQVYRTGGSMPEGPWRTIEKEYARHATWGEVSTAHASNAMTVVTSPGEGLYRMCAGPARRGLVPMMPNSTIAIYGETNAFWELKLCSTPEEVLRHARQKAEGLLARATKVVGDCQWEPTALAPLQALLALSRAELAAGDAVHRSGDVAALAKAARAYTRAQVRAEQAWQALVPPPPRIEPGQPAAAGPKQVTGGDTPHEPLRATH
jgi:hypothetical protein